MADFISDGSISDSEDNLITDSDGDVLLDNWNTYINILDVVKGTKLTIRVNPSRNEIYVNT